MRLVIGNLPKFDPFHRSRAQTKLGHIPNGVNACLNRKKGPNERVALGLNDGSKRFICISRLGVPMVGKLLFLYYCQPQRVGFL